MTPTDPTGRRFVLRHGDAVAEIAQLGAALRAFAVDGTDFVPRYPDDVATPAASGITLVPWVNRVRGGEWTQRGQTRQLAITEPAFGNASHGLLRFAPYAVEAEAEDELTLRADVFPQTGYPFHLENRVTFTLRASSLTMRHHLRNVGADEAPVAVGAHPFLRVGDAPIADLTLRSSGTHRLVVDDSKIPVAEEPVDAATDLRAGRRVGDLDLDASYRRLARHADGRVRHTLTAPDGTSLTMWQGPGFEWTQVFTTDRFPGLDLAIAVEPMTAPPDALNSGTDLRWLQSGESWALEWGLEAARPESR